MSLFSAPAAAVLPYSIDSLAVKKLHFTGLIDSLDLEKQEFKRNAKTVAELELQQATLRDSLQKIRLLIQKRADYPAATKTMNTRHSPVFLSKPESLFDWIIIIVGTIAIFSGILLAAGIFKNFIVPSKRHRKNRQTAAPQPSEQIYKPDAEKPIYPPASTASAPASSPPVNPTRQAADSATIASLQKRMQNIIPEPEKSSSVLPKPTPPAHHQNPQVVVNEEKQLSVEQKVIEAAKNGMDTATISRTFHLSSDHIALILKIAKNI